jgi:hypothetical protein
MGRPVAGQPSGAGARLRKLADRQACRPAHGSACAVTAPCQPGARSTLSACAVSAAAAERAARREGDASASESSHASASYHRTGRAQGDAPGAGLRSSSRCPPQRPGRNETPAGKGSGGCSDDPRRERESAERRSSPVCHPSLHRLPLHRLALQVNSYAILYAELRLRQGQLVALGRTLSTFRSDAKLRRQTVRQHWLETEVRFWEAVWRYKGGRWRP